MGEYDDSEQYIKSVPGYKRKYPKSWSLSMTPKELFYFLFKKKRCREFFCDGKLHRYTCTGYAGLRYFADYGDSGYSKWTRNYETEIRYRCPDCGRDYTLSELALGEEINPDSNLRETKDQIIAHDQRVVAQRENRNLKPFLVFIILFIVVPPVIGLLWVALSLL